MCVLRAGLVSDRRKCRSSVRFHCTLKKKTGTMKTYIDNKQITKEK